MAGEFEFPAGVEGGSKTLGSRLRALGSVIVDRCKALIACCRWLVAKTHFSLLATLELTVRERTLFVRKDRVREPCF